MSGRYPSSVSVAAALERSYRRADLLLQVGLREEAAKLHEATLCFDLQTTLQLPRTVVRWIDTRRHLRRDALGNFCTLVLQVDVTAGCLEVNAPLPERLSERLQRQLVTFRHILMRGESSTLLFRHAAEITRVERRPNGIRP